MKKLLYFVIGCVLAIAVGIQNLVPTIKLLCNTVINGVDWAVAHLEKPVEEYLKGLKRLTTCTFLPPLLVSILAFFAGWNTVMGWAGVWCFVWTLVLGTYGALLGALIDALATAGRTGAWAKGETGLLSRRLKSYISFARQVLIYEAAAFLTLNIVPMQNYWSGVPVFLLIVGLLIITSYEWGTKTGKWLKPLMRFASFAALAFLLLRFCLPSLLPSVNFFNLLWYGGKPPEEIVKGGTALSGTQDITEEHIGSLVGGIGKWIAEHWDKPSFWIGLAVVALLAYLAVRLFKKAVAPAGATGGSGQQTATVAASTHGSGGQGSLLWKALMIACLVLCAGMAAMTVMKVMEMHERRKAYIDSSARDAQISAEARRTMSLLAQVNGRAAATQVTATVPVPAPASAPMELWYGLVNPKKYSIVLSTNLSERIPRPYGLSVRLAPGGLNEELWANGRRIPRVPGTLTALPPGTTNIQVRWTNPTPFKVVVGVGPEVK